MSESPDLPNAGSQDLIPTFPQTGAHDAPPDDAGTGTASPHRAQRFAARVRAFIGRRGPRMRIVLSWLVALAGLAVIGAGIVMLVVPGPGIVTILGGVTILGVLSPRLERLLVLVIDWGQRTWAGARAWWAASRARTDRVT